MKRTPIKLRSLKSIALKRSVWHRVFAAKYLDNMRKYYNCNVNDRFFVVRDLVLHKK